MPRKKTADGAEAPTANSETKFSWTTDNDRTLLLLSLGRNIGPADYEKFITALPAGTNFQGVRQRFSKLRVEQKKKYEELGWELTTEATAKAKVTAVPKKRKGSQDGDADEETPAKAKKPRAKKAAKSEEKMQDEEEGGDEGGEELVTEEGVDEAV